MPHGRHLRNPYKPERVPSRRLGFKIFGLFAVLAVVLGGVYAGFNEKPHALRLTSDTAADPLFGASVNWQTLAPETAQLGHMPVVRVYYPSTPPATAWTTSPAGLAKSAVVVSWKTLPAEILSGADDAALEHFFDTAPTNYPIYWSYWHEPEDEIASGLFSLADYKAAWEHIAAIAAAAHNPELHSTLILMAWDLNPASHRNFEDYIPSGNIISTLGWDAYPAGSIQDTNVQLTSPADFLGPEIAASKSVGLPFGFAEFALATQDGRPGWLNEVAQYLDTSGALFATYFDSTGWPSMELTDSASIDAWRSIIATSGSDPSGGSSPAPATSSPAPTPSASATSTTPTSAFSVTGLSVSPDTMTADAGQHVALSFMLSAAANVTVCILDDTGKVLRQISMPSRNAGQVSVNYYGRDDSRANLAPGSYSVLVVASNASGSATAESTLTITAS
jgi:ABC-type cobalt transport system substrate-binding protein